VSAAEAELINTEGFRVRMPVRGRKELVEIGSRALPGKVSAAGTTSRQDVEQLNPVSPAQDLALTWITENPI